MSTEYNIDQTIPLITNSSFEIVLARIVEILKFEELNQEVQATNSGKAQGTLTVSENPVDGDVFTVGSKVYLLQVTLTDSDGNIQIGTNLAATQLNIVAAFDLSGVAGTQYAASMSANTDVDIAAFLDDLSAILTAKTSGVVGNAIATTSVFSDGGNLFDGLTLGTTRAGVDIDLNDWNFKVVEQIANPFRAFQDFQIPLVNILFVSGQLKSRSKLDKRNAVTYAIQIFAQEDSSDTEQGMSVSLATVNRVMRQILYILESPKYINLRLNYNDDDGNLVKFIEKLSVTNMEAIFPKDPFPKENVTMGTMAFSVTMDERLFDLQGTSLDTIDIDLLPPIT